MSRISHHKRGLATFLCVLLVAGFLAQTALAAPSTEAESGQGPPKFARIYLFEVSFSISSAGLTSNYCKVKLYDLTDTVKLTMELQRLEGIVWVPIKSWSTTGSSTVSIDKDWYVLSGYKYRVQGIAQVSNSSGTLLEIATATSSTVTY